MVDKTDPLLSSPAPLFSLLAPLESISNGWYGLPFLDVSSITTYITALHHTVTHLTLFQVHVSHTPCTPATPPTHPLHHCTL